MVRTTPGGDRRRSAVTFGILVLIAFAVRLVLPMFPSGIFIPSRGALEWPFVAAIAVCGALGILISRQVGIPEMWDPRISNRRRIVIPAFFGFTLALMTIAHSVMAGGRTDNATPFPYSVAVFAYGAIFLETMLRLFLLPLFIWILGFITRERWPRAIFWIAAFVVSVYEAGEFFSYIGGPHTLNASLVIVRLVVGNLLACYLMLRAGFIAPLTMRASDYLIWHILWPLAR